MKTLRHDDPGFARKLDLLCAASSLFDSKIEASSRSIVERVGLKGDAALIEFSKKFDGAKLTASTLRVEDAEIQTAGNSVEGKLKCAIGVAHRNIRDFHKRGLRKGWSGRNAQGARVGEKYDAFDRVGVYIPGGTAPLMSTALMTVTLAKVAGCKEIVICTPCDKEGEVNPGLLHAAKVAGATEIYRVGGAHAIAALALGTKTIAPVQKIFGPGNAYVVAAKRLLVGHVSIDLLPGPSELLVLADASANPAYAASDILAQAEHGSGHERCWLISTSSKVITAVKKEIEKQLPNRSRRKYIQKALNKNGWLIQVKSIGESIRLANRLAPEHCELMLTNPKVAAKEIVTAGALFLGNDSPTVTGDYLAGPSHTLPTGGAGASFSGLTVDMFQRRTSMVEYSKRALNKSISVIEQFAGVEGLDAHGRSASIRLES
jgi:histidinol dehydrogenase